MSSSNGKKRSHDTIDLTGSSPPPPHRPTKSSRHENGTPGNSRRDQLRAEGSSSQAGPAQSQASQYRHEEDGGNELVDDIDAFYGDDIDCLYELYGRFIAWTGTSIVSNTCRYYKIEGCRSPVLPWTCYVWRDGPSAARTDQCIRQQCHSSS